MGKTTGKTILGEAIRRGREELCWIKQSYTKSFENSEDGLLLIDAEQHVLFDVNQKFIDLLGYGRDELIAKPITDVWPEKLSDLVDLAYAVINNGNILHREVECESKDGRFLRLEVSAWFVDLNGWPSILLVVTDKQHTGL